MKGGRLWGALASLGVLLSAIWLAGVGVSKNLHGIYAVLFFLATLFVALPSALDLGKQLKDGFGLPTSIARSLEAMMKSGVISLYRDNLATSTNLHDPLQLAPYPDDITRLGFHVWLVSKRRRMIPYPLRCAVADKLSDEVKDKPYLNPRLKKAAEFTIAPRAMSANIVVGRGRGIVGTCLKTNDPDKIVRVNWERQDRRDLMETGDRATWKAAAFHTNFGLTLKEATALSSVYGQAAAMVIRKRSGEAVGCVTLDLPPGVLSVDLEDEDGLATKRLLTYLRDVRDQVATIHGI